MFMDFKGAYNSVWREVLYSDVTHFGVPMKPGSLIKTGLNETYSNVRIGKYLPEY
jgi:hypothetical protein